MSSNQRNESGRVRVRQVRRTSTDMKKLARVVIALAQAQAEAEAQAQAATEDGKDAGGSAGTA